MKTIVAILAFALAALVAQAAGTGTGMPMMKGLKDPTQLATLVDRALQRDATGHSLLDSARCKKDGSCATAYDYFHGIQLAHPSAKLDGIAELPRYLRSLVKQPAPAGEWFMSRLLVKGEKRTYDHVAWHRAFFKGEDVWDDPNTGEHILAGFCENIVGSLKSPVAEKETPVKIRDVALEKKAEALSCVTVKYIVKPGDEIRFAVLAHNRLPASACWQLCDGDVCSAPPSPCDVCDWIGPKSVIPTGFEPLHTGRYVAQAMHQTLRFPREVMTSYIALCDERDGAQSDSWIVQPSAWSTATVTVPYGGQAWPAWGQVDMSKWRKP